MLLFSLEPRPLHTYKHTYQFNRNIFTRKQAIHGRLDLEAELRFQGLFLVRGAGSSRLPTQGVTATRRAWCRLVLVDKLDGLWNALAGPDRRLFLYTHTKTKHLVI